VSTPNYIEERMIIDKQMVASKNKEKTTLKSKPPNFI
jgi:hypothetical protein